MIPAIFLDRDGVIIQNRDTYVRAWSDVEFLPNALQALARLAASHYSIVLVTNQSVVGRGIISLQKATEINARVVENILQAGGRIDGVFMCPHAPDDHCDCRKPRPGLLNQAAQLLSIDLSRSIMIGDALTDIQAGKNAGVEIAILVRTGRGEVQRELPQATALQPFIICEDLSTAVKTILG